MGQWRFDDGGRAEAGFKGVASDCAARAIAIATGRAYIEVYNDLAKRNADEGGAQTAREGISMKVMRAYMAENGWTWHPMMKIGQGCKVHLHPSELPGGKIIVRLSRHYAAVIDGVTHDNHDSTREGTRCVYGYWMPAD
jgi:hypothetical protein